jgi:hypothetical protein
MSESESTVALPARRHRWLDCDEKRIAACDSPDGNDRTEKKCPVCGLVKITVHPPHGFPWREWRRKGGERVYGQATPPCIDAAPAGEDAA